KALAEMVRAVWLAGRGDQERQMLAPRGVEHGLQVRMHRDRQRDAGLLLLHREHAVADVLPPYLYDITTPLRRVEQQGERVARLRADWMMRLISPGAGGRSDYPKLSLRGGEIRDIVPAGKVAVAHLIEADVVSGLIVPDFRPRSEFGSPSIARAGAAPHAR